MSGARPRGQASVELALGLIVFVTILLFGIHFAEMGSLSAKVHEASAAALWDSTAYRSYKFGAWYDSGRIAVPSTTVATQRRYEDFDGRASVTNAAGPSLVLTQADPMTVNCVSDPGVAYGLAPLAPSFGEARGASCVARSEARVLRFPTSFLEGSGGLSQTSHYARGSSPSSLCSSGRASGGRCPGRLSILLGDDALNEGREAVECPLAASSPAVCATPPPFGGNQPFYDLTLDTWNKSMRLTAGWSDAWTGRPEAFARDIAPGLPGGRITGFYFSFRGEESNFTEPVRNGGPWQTNPMDAPLPGSRYRQSYNISHGCALANGYCFLGKFPCK